MSLDLAEVDRALAAVEDAGVPFQIGFNRRFDPGHAAVAAAVADGSVGEPQLVRISSRDPAPPPMAYVRGSGGIFLDMTIHDFDMARFVSGSEVVEVFARGTVRIDDGVRRGRRRRHRGGHARARGRLPDHDRQLPPGGLRLRPARRGVRLGRHGGVREPAGARRPSCARATGARAAALPYFFLERYIPSYLAASGQAFVGRGVGRRGAAGRPAGDARAPLVIGLAAWRSLREGRPVSPAEVAA